MSEHIRQVAARLKESREIAGITADALARDIKVSGALYRKYESGAVDIPVGVLLEAARKLNVELTGLLTGEEPKLHQYSLVRKGTGPRVDRRKEYKYSDLAFNFVRKKAEIFLITAEPKPAGRKPVTNSHPGQEFTYLLEGSMKVLLGGHEVTLKAGDSLFFDSGVQHAMVAVGGKAARFLAVIL